MELDHYDPLGRPPIKDAQHVINWVLEGLHFPKVLTVESEVDPLQSPTSSSCGVATEIFLATKAGINRPRWSQGQSATRHGEWIWNLITYHMTALEQPLHNSRDWFIMDTAYPVLFHNPQQALEPEFGLEYHNYNLYNVTQAHPVHSFGTLRPKQFLTLQCGTSQSDSPSALLPVVELKCTPLKRHFISVYDLQATTATSLDLSSTNMWNSLQDDIDMSPLWAPLAEAEASWSDMIKISDSSPSVHQRLTTRNLKQRLTLTENQHKPETVPVEVGPGHCGYHDTTQNSGNESDREHWEDTPDGAPLLLSVYDSLEDARKAIYGFGGAWGNKMHVGQSKRVSKSVDSKVKKVTYHCSCYVVHKPKHKGNIDLSNFCDGKSIRKNCSAHVNNRILPTMQWHITAADWTHTHDPVLAPGVVAPHPPQPEQRAAVTDYACAGNFTQDHLRTILHKEFLDHILEDHPISNILNAARAEGREEVSWVGDMATIIARLDAKIADGEGWQYKIRLDNSQKVVGLWWQSPEQAQLAACYHDILINDNSHNHNQYGHPLNIGIVVDNYGKSRNIWYCFQEREDTWSHAWVLQDHLETARRAPEVFVSD
ncbi:hypothetical protein K439DRAFT_1622334 [Ramaria rubella]|nr:hypothetical protein K439DRAFT_1622334 [Ramaria rubella]